MIGTHNPLNHIRPRALVRNAGTGSRTMIARYRENYDRDLFSPSLHPKPE